MQETWVQSLGQKDPLEKKMTIHSSILAWEIHGQWGLRGAGSATVHRVTRIGDCLAPMPPPPPETLQIVWCNPPGGVI